MTEKDSQIELEVGDPVITLDTNEKATVSRLCSDEALIFIRWDQDKSQEMVEKKNLRKA